MNKTMPQGATESLTDLVQQGVSMATTTSPVSEKGQEGASERTNAHIDSSVKPASATFYETVDAERLAVIHEDLEVLPADIATLLSECLIQRGSHPIEASKSLFERCKEHLLPCNKTGNYVKNVMNSNFFDN